MITRLSKIARLPAVIREQLNRRLHNGDLGRTILPWLNGLPETKRVLAELFDAKPVTHQNLSEWRRGGYQDWFLLQHRLQWFDRLTEQETELEKNDCGDAYETVGWHFLFEIGQGLAELQNIKNTDHRFARLQTLTREFARLQNAFNWSRRVQLEWDKWKNEPVAPEEPQQPISQIEENNDAEEDDNIAEEDENKNNMIEAEIDKTDDNKELEVASEFTESPPLGSEGTIENSPAVHCGVNSATAQVPEGRLKEPSLNSSNTAGQCAQISSAAGTTSPSPIGWERAGVRAPADETDSPVSLKSLAFGPIPPLAPTTRPPSNLNPQPRTPRPPIRGRRFVCVEG